MTHELPSAASAPPVKNCPQCGLTVAASVRKCPNDGTDLYNPFLGEPELFNKYEYIGKIGAGGMGVLYKARQKALNKLVAIKMVHAHVFATSPDTMARFELEARAIAALSHRFIVQIFDLGTTSGGQPFMVMDFLNGQTLADLFQEPELSVQRSLRIFAQIATGLGHAHKRGVIHRDIKPSNIMLIRTDEGEEEVRIMDFGIAKVATDTESASQQLTRTGEIFGSPLYMSPEQAKGEKTDARTDQYSLGCMVYEAFTGSPPHCGGSPLDTILKHINDDPQLLEEAAPGITFDPSIQRMITRLLQKNPDLRFPTMEDVAAELNRILRAYEEAATVEIPQNFDHSSIKASLSPNANSKRPLLGRPAEVVHQLDIEKAVKDYHEQPNQGQLKKSLKRADAASGRLRTLTVVTLLGALVGGTGAAVYLFTRNHNEQPAPNVVTDVTTPVMPNDAQTITESQSGSADVIQHKEEMASVWSLYNEKQWHEAYVEAETLQTQLARERVPNYHDIIWCYMLRGECQRFLNHYDQAIDLYGRGIKIAKANLPDSNMLEMLYENSAKVSQLRGRPEDVARFKQERKLFQQLHAH